MIFGADLEVDGDIKIIKPTGKLCFGSDCLDSPTLKVKSGASDCETFDHTVGQETGYSEPPLIDSICTGHKVMVAFSLDASMVERESVQEAPTAVGSSDGDAVYTSNYAHPIKKLRFKIKCCNVGFETP